MKKVGNIKTEFTLLPCPYCYGNGRINWKEAYTKEYLSREEFEKRKRELEIYLDKHCIGDIMQEEMFKILDGGMNDK